MVTLARDISMEEHLVAAGAKNPTASAAALAEEEIESFEELLAIDDHLLLEVLHRCGIKTGSAAKIYSYCAAFRSSGGAVAAAAEECASNDLSAVQNEIDELQAILDDSSDQVGLSVVICLLVLSHP